MYAVDPDVSTENKEDLKSILENMLLCLNKPVIDESVFEEKNEI